MRTKPEPLSHSSADREGKAATPPALTRPRPAAPTVRVHPADPMVMVHSAAPTVRAHLAAPTVRHCLYAEKNFGLSGLSLHLKFISAHFYAGCLEADMMQKKIRPKNIRPQNTLVSEMSY